VLPQSLLTTRDAAAIRADALRRGALASMWSSPTMLFDASVRTCALVFELGGRQGPISRAWGPSFTRRPSAMLGESWGRLLLESVDRMKHAAAARSATSPASPSTSGSSTTASSERSATMGQGRRW
jgi:hypothetical protein